MKKRLLKFSLGIAMLLLLAAHGFSATYTTIAPGSWTSGSTWAGGQAPNTDVAGHTIIINHDVTVVNNDIKLMSGAAFVATGVSFTMSNGNFVVENGSASFAGCEVEVAHGFSIQITTVDGSLRMVGCQVHVGQNFQLSEGYRYLEDVCLIVDESFQNAKGTDTLINVCALIGDSTSGNFQNDSESDMYILDSEFHLPNGNFQNQSSANLSGHITAIWVENGDLESQGNWTATIDDHCVSQQVIIPSQYLLNAENCTTIADYFNPCSCSAGGTPLAIQVTLVGNVECYGDNSGSADITVSGGTAPYSFAWSNGATTEDLAGVGAGTYTVTVTDANANSATATVTISQPTALAASCGSDGSTFTACGGSGSVFVHVSGGSAPYTYLWSNGATSATVTGLPAGSYSVTVTDHDGCTTTCSTTLAGAASTLEVACTGVNPSTCTSTDGQASVGVSGGSAPFSYLWSNGSITSTTSGLSAGTYTVVVTDADGCTASCSATLVAPNVDTCHIAPGEFRTQTQGGWGSSCSGNNPGCYRDANFAAAFPGGLVVGCNFTVTLTSSAAVENYLPCGGPSAVLTSSHVDPNCLNNVLLSQLIAATLSVTFDAYDPNFGASSTALGALVVSSGPMAGLTVSQVLYEANQAVGGCGSIYSLGDLNTTLSDINQNFVDGTMAGGSLSCPLNPCTVVGGSNVRMAAPTAYAWPNPAQGKVNVNYFLAASADVTVHIMNADGAEVLRSQELRGAAEGWNIFTWDGADAIGNRMSAGLYLVRFTNGKSTESVKVILQ